MYQLGLDSASWKEKSQHHSGPIKIINVSIKEICEEVILGGMAAPKVIRDLGSSSLLLGHL